MAGNSFTNWNRVTPRHNAFVQKILQSPCHIIATIRSKQDYVLTDKNGKMVPEKVGLKGVTREVWTMNLPWYSTSISNIRLQQAKTGQDYSLILCHS